MPRKPRMSLEERRERRAQRKAAQVILPPPRSEARQYVAESVPDDGKIHVPKIMNPDPAILPWQVQRAIEYYLDTPERNLTTDVDDAARKAGMLPALFRGFFKQIPVQEIIKKKADLIDQAIAERRASARVLTEDFLDSKTIEVLSAVGEVATAPRVKMIEVGYRRFGMLKDRVENTGANGAPLTFQLVRLGAKKDPDEPSNDAAV